MENKSSPDVPQFCINNCGFYGSPIYNYMCSKCFKDTQQQQQQATQANVENAAQSLSAVTESPRIGKDLNIQSPTPAAMPESLPLEPSTAIETAPNDKVDVSVDVSLEAPAAPPLEADKDKEEKEPTKPVQTNKGRCFVCKAKIPLAKQSTNRCRCEYVFCDTHRYPDRHACEHDFRSEAKDELARKNPRLIERPRGGRSFNRLD
ncbi:uncharacterized protein VTP21DRAFT_10940 [Calcarisporiella thermophila]|uniref:uncharacterized protein n=1 Tax=Calcarisporiella thermophila TaxID=911321 RepID=UPI0037441C85